MTFWEAVLLGVLQGLTEFFPISSSAHIEIGTVVLGRASKENLLFSIYLHLATLCSTLWVFRLRLWGMLKELFSRQWTPTHRWILLWVLSAIPAGIVGITCESFIQRQFGGNLQVVGLCLCVTALWLFGGRIAQKNKQKSLGFGSAIAMGAAQACALLPGISRSGATLATAALIGIRQSEAAFFSFMMAIIPITGAALLKGIQYYTLSPQSPTTSLSTMPLLGGTAAAFIVGLWACKYVVKWVQKGKIHYFAFYCLALGIGAILWNN